MLCVYQILHFLIFQSPVVLMLLLLRHVKVTYITLDAKAKESWLSANPVPVWLLLDDECSRSITQRNKGFREAKDNPEYIRTCFVYRNLSNLLWSFL